MEKLVAALSACGFRCSMPGGSYFLYTPAPRGVEGGPEFASAEAASQYLITEKSIVTVPWDDAGAFLRFSVTYVADDPAAEDALMAETVARLQQIQTGVLKATALNRIGMVTARMNRTSDAKNIFREVQKTVGEVSDAEARSALLTRMAYAYGKYLGESREAADLLDRAEQDADQIARPEGRIEALLEVAYTYFGLGEEQQAQQRVDRTLDDARGLEDVRKRADSLASAAAIVIKMKQADTAKSLFQEAQQTAGEIPDPLSRAYAYVHLGTKLIAADLKGAAQKILQLAEASADQVTDQSMRGPLMEKIYATRRQTTA
jgi:tetratricopeptide (TPR) repeat protein